jgi:choice-of-anchor B domain-containing protein
MKKIKLSLVLLSIATICNAQIAKKMTLLSSWNNPNLNKVDSFNIWNDLIGYYDSLTQKEYAIAGSTDSIYFFDISIPTQIKLVDVEYGSVKGVINRDYEIYQNYVYCVADQNRSTLQVFDLKYLPDSVHKVYDDSAIAINTHSIFIEAKSKRLYMCSNRYPNKVGGKSAMDIISLENPEKPVFLAKLDIPLNPMGEPIIDHVHEALVKNDTGYLSCGYNGLYIYDLRDLKNQKIIGTITNYPQVGYNHSSSLNKDGKNIMFSDEVPAGLSMKIFDIDNFNEPKIVSTFISNIGATPHNLFWVGNAAVVSHYHDGVVIWDLTDIKSPKKVAYYDTYPQNAPGDYKILYAGCWGVWPFLPSKNIIASDRSNGIFVLRADDDVLSNREEEQQNAFLNIYPNPSNGILNIAIEGGKKDIFEIEILDLHGKKVMAFDKIFENNYLYSENIETLKRGIYFLNIKGEKNIHKFKFIKQ